MAHTPTGSGFGGAGSPGSGGSYPVSPTSTPSPMPLFIPDPSIKGVAFDQLLQNRGIKFIHRKASTCPNMESISDNNHNPNCSVCDGNGIFFYEEKEIWGVFYGNSLEKNFEYQGLWEVGSAVVTLPTEYPDGTVADFNTYDQLVIVDFTSKVWELKEYAPTTDGKQIFRYPVEAVDLLASVNDNQLIQYQNGINYTIDGGAVKWISGSTPSYDSVNKKGDIYVIQYYAKPVYNILQHMRELRVSQELLGGQKIAKRMPSQVLVRRDFLSNSPIGVGK